MINFGKGFFRIVLVVSVFILLLSPIPELERPLATEMEKYQDGLYEKWKSGELVLVKMIEGEQKRISYSDDPDALFPPRKRDPNKSYSVYWSSHWRNFDRGFYKLKNPFLKAFIYTKAYIIASPAGIVWFGMIWMVYFILRFIAMGFVSKNNDS